MNNLYDLSEQMDLYLQGKSLAIDVENVILEIKKIVADFKSGSIGVAQINTVVGDIEYNSKKIMKYISYAQRIGLDMVVFPELSIIGSPIGDTILRYPILVQENVKWLTEIAKFTHNLTVVVGFIEPSEVDSKCYNALAILSNGKIQKVIRKSSLQDSLECSESRTFISDCNEDSGYHFGGIKYAFSIDEDFKMLQDDFDVVVNCSSSISRTGKEARLNKEFSLFLKDKRVSFVNVNRVGATDNYSYNGASRVYNANGDLLARAKSFEEQFIIVNPLENIGKIYPLPYGEEFGLTQEDFSLDYENDLERIYKTLVQGIRDYFNKNGLERACLGLSGGLDSTVCAVLLADALGKENVYGVSMPSKITSVESKSDAEQLAVNLGINFVEVPIKDIVETTNKIFDNLFQSVENSWNCRYKKSFTQDNIQARSRAMYLFGISNEFSKCIPIATSDKSESYMGYATINGDMSGGFAPITDVTKTRLFALAKWMNKNRTEKNVIPVSIIKKRPGAELAIDERTGKPLIAEDALMPYEFLDEIIWRVENKNESYEDMLDSEFIYEKANNVSREQKTEWLDKFFRRMSTSGFKWTLLPPAIIVDSYSINKSDYFQPASSSRMNFKGVDLTYIKEVLEGSLLVEYC